MPYNLVPAKFTPPRDAETEEFPLKTMKPKKQFNAVISQNGFSLHADMSCRKIATQAAKTKSTSQTSPGCLIAKSSRKDTPAKSKRVRPPAPKTFEEMKERLGDSAREALSKAYPLLKKLNLAPTEHHGDTPPESSTCAASSGVTEDVPSPGSCSDERVELTDNGTFGASFSAFYGFATFLITPHDRGLRYTTLPYRLRSIHPWHTVTTPSTLSMSVHAYPTVYQPSQPRSDPFVVMPHAWLRDHRTTPRESIGPTAEAVANTLSGFDCMDIDELSEKMKGGWLPRNVTLELYGIWFSNESTIPLPCSSRAGLSPLFSDAKRPTSSESALEAHLDAPRVCTGEIPENGVSLASGASLDPEAKMEAETACDSRGDNSTTICCEYKMSRCLWSIHVLGVRMVWCMYQPAGTSNAVSIPRQYIFMQFDCWLKPPNSLGKTSERHLHPALYTVNAWNKKATKDNICFTVTEAVRLRAGFLMLNNDMI
ncbi:hypothetical protein JB92DRAFT_2832271 [Gautieria morchelliformis]|nr:hypothetical protein JB92DRAFT_2832271 [Gautieria morchelliformis]